MSESVNITIRDLTDEEAKGLPPGVNAEDVVIYEVGAPLGVTNRGEVIAGVFLPGQTLSRGPRIRMSRNPVQALHQHIAEQVVGGKVTLLVKRNTFTKDVQMQAGVWKEGGPDPEIEPPPLPNVVPLSSANRPKIEILAEDDDDTPPAS